MLAAGYHPRHSPLGIGWTAITAVVMFALAAGKARAGAALNNPVLKTEGRVTLADGLLAAAVLLGLILNTAIGWWWADPAQATCWSATRPARYARSSPPSTDRHKDHRQGRRQPVRSVRTSSRRARDAAIQGSEHGSAEFSAAVRSVAVSP